MNAEGRRRGASFLPAEPCPECFWSLRREGRCLLCPACGWSTCP